MTFPRILSAAAAAAVIFSCISCTDRNEKAPRISRYRDKEKEYRIGQSYSEDTGTESEHHSAPPHLAEADEEKLNEIEGIVQQLVMDLERSGSEDEIRNRINTLIDRYNSLYDERTMAEVAFYGNYTDDSISDIYDGYCRNLAVAEALITYGFHIGQQSEYSSLFQGLLPADAEEQYSNGDYDTEAVRIEAEMAYQDASEYLYEYYDIIGSEKLSDDEKDLKCAEILLEMLSDYTPETLYEQYNRDYTGEDILALSETVAEEMLPAYDALIDAYVNSYITSEFDITEPDIGDPFYVIRNYAQKLSPDISKSADRIVKEQLYTIKNDDSAFEGAFTDELPSENSAYIFIGNVSDDHLLGTAVHEFGHFHASFYDDTPALAITDNIDLAEIQSQGFELLFTQFYDDIYDQSGNNMRLYTLADLCDAVTCGFMVGKFEYDLVSDAENLSPEDVVELFGEAASYYDGSLHLYEIEHLFESPGYYISYATSALASLELFDDVMNDKEKALEKYESIAKISCNSDEYTFREALKKCGFRDVLSKESITRTADMLKKYAEELS